MITKLKENLYALLLKYDIYGTNGFVEAARENNAELLGDILNYPLIRINDITKCRALHVAISAGSHQSVYKLIEDIVVNPLTFAVTHRDSVLTRTLLTTSMLTFSAAQQGHALKMAASQGDLAIIEVLLSQATQDISTGDKVLALIKAAQGNYTAVFKAILANIGTESLDQIVLERLFLWAVQKGHFDILDLFPISLADEAINRVKENERETWLERLALNTKTPHIIEHLVHLIDSRGYPLSDRLLKHAKAHLSNIQKCTLFAVLSPCHFEIWLQVMGSAITSEARVDALKNKENIPAIVRQTVDLDSLLFLVISNDYDDTFQELLKYQHRLTVNGIIEALIEADINNNIQALLAIAKVWQPIPAYLRAQVMLYAIQNNRHSIIHHVIAHATDIPANYIRLARAMAEEVDEEMLMALGNVPGFIDDLYEVTDDNISEAKQQFQSNELLMQYSRYCNEEVDNNETVDMVEDLDEEVDDRFDKGRRVSNH